MKTYVEEKTHADTELTLGTSSILGIFFGLALICGVFFGLGYSLGRGNTRPVAAPQAALPTPDSDGPDAAPVKTLVDQSSSTAPDSDASPNDTASKPSGATVQPEPASATPALTPDSAEPPTSAPQAEKVAAPPAAKAAPVPSPEPAATIMVQIAAVSRREDADVLVSALSKHGYNASVRQGATDNLLHVQIGPFATRGEAKAMSTKLLNDGYNAILK